MGSFSVHEEYQSGEKELKGNFKNGKKEGLWTEWYRNGQKSFEGTSKDGELVEVIGVWNEDGSVKE